MTTHAQPTDSPTIGAEWPDDGVLRAILRPLRSERARSELFRVGEEHSGDLPAALDHLAQLARDPGYRAGYAGDGAALAGLDRALAVWAQRHRVRQAAAPPTEGSTR